MDYEIVMQKIKGLENFGSKPGLERISKLLDFVGNPQNNLDCIHVAGTNGKGSVCFALDSILRAEGYKVGRYISPSICGFRERIAINGENIGKKDLVELFAFFEPYIQRSEFKHDPITEFELTTAMAFKFFADNNCDIVVLETGMGGRLDATNVIKKPVCAVITPISMDHIKILGNDISKIATEKLGIVKQDCPVVVSDAQSGEVYKLAEDVSKKLNTSVVRAYKSELKKPQMDYSQGLFFEYKDEKIETNILGNHQLVNLSCALKVIEVINNGFPIKLANIKKALNTLVIPCRLECVSKNPTIILDAAHNPQGMAVLCDFLKENFSNKKIYGIVGMFRDKDYEASLRNILGVFDTVYTISPNEKRAETLEKITMCAKKYCRSVFACGSMELAIKKLMRTVKNDDIIVAFGSFSVMKEFKTYMNSEIKFEN